MRVRVDVRLAALLVIATGCAAGEPAPSRAAGDPTPAGAAGAADGPIVLELFTSQGCSSCPPADRWLASLAPGDRVAGRRVIPLAFHVDYWNDLGWFDPFSTAAWSGRQEWYAERLPRGRVYTPALVVAGVTHEVGSHLGAIARAVDAAPPTSDLDATISREGDHLRVVAAASDGAQVLAAIVEREHATRVEAGENEGAELLDRHIVRALVPVRGEVEVTVEPAWGDVGVVVFAQQSGGAIIAARAFDAPPP